MEENKKIFKGTTKIILIIFAVIAAIVILFNSFFVVNEKEYAVITTFGVPSAETTSGLKVKIPFIQQVKKVSSQIFGLSIGYDINTNESIAKESSMITSDSNFIDVDFYLEYRVVDPVKFLYNSAEPIAILKTLAQSYSRDIVGLHTVDEVLTTGKQQIQTEIRESIASRIETEDIGIQVLNFTIQDAEPPTDEVLDSFKNVETAKQQKETAINNANKYKNEKEPEAEAKVDKIIKDAEAIKQARINEAEGQVSRFNSMFQEFIKNPLQTKTRMFYETMEEVLPKVKIIIDDGNGSTTKFLPLDQLK